jgi:hypothetical protein
VAKRRERVILDPAEVAIEGREELDLHNGAILIRPEGIDWGQSEIEAFMAKQKVGERVIDYVLPNRVITIPLLLGGEGSGEDYDAARVALEAKVSRINEDGGGWLKRELIGGSYGEAGKYLFADIEKATLKLGDDTKAILDAVDDQAELILEALPDFYGDWVEGEVHEGIGDVSWTEQIKGNLPGRVDLGVTEKSEKRQSGLAWHFRRAHYSAAGTANWAYEAEALTKLDAAAEIELAGASGTKVIRHNKLGTDWTPVLSTNLKAGTYLTHSGLYDVWVRIFTTSEELPWLRLVYGVGDTVNAAPNQQVQIPGINNFYLVPLGQVNLGEMAVASHRWQGLIQARGSVGGENISIDRLWFLDDYESSGVVTAKNPFGIGSNTYKVRDEFNQAAGVLTGQTAAVGGTYVVLTNSDADDFATTGTEITRASVSDTGTLL